MSWNTIAPERRALIEATLTKLQLEVVKGRIDGHSFQRIADAMSLDQATVRGHYKRALRRLADARKDQAA